ncbi:MAG: HAD family phosphatase [Chlamydiia bacterium]|nr:HAD family phosphatase [Chlamydiia bacterium]
MTLRALLFDLDGTVADSVPVLYEVYRGFLAQFALEGSREEFARLNGPSILEGIAYLRKKHSLAHSTEELYAGYCSLFRDSYAGVLKPFPGTEDFLRFLAEHEVKLALVTSAPRLVEETFVTAQGLSSYFQEIVTADDITNSKPHPEPYQKALSLLDVPAEDALVVEDSVHGVHSGLAAGIPTVMIQHRPADGLAPEGVLAVVNSWAQLRRVIENRVVYA